MGEVSRDSPQRSQLSSSADVRYQGLQFGEVLIVNPSGSYRILVAQNSRCCRGDCVLGSITHELSDRPGYMSDADVLSGHHHVVKVCGV